MFGLFFDFGVDFICTSIKTFDWMELIVVHQETAEVLKDLLLHLELVVPLHLLDLDGPSSKQPPLALVTFVLVCLLPVMRTLENSPQDPCKVSSVLFFTGPLPSV